MCVSFALLIWVGFPGVWTGGPVALSVFAWTGSGWDCPECTRCITPLVSQFLWTGHPYALTQQHLTIFILFLGEAGLHAAVLQHLCTFSVWYCSAYRYCSALLDPLDQPLGGGPCGCMLSYPSISNYGRVAVDVLLWVCRLTREPGQS